MVSFFVLGAKLLGALKEMIFAWRFGTTGIADAYLYVLNLLSAPVSIFYGAATALFVPTLVKMRVDRNVFKGELLGNTILLSIASSALFAFLIWIVLRQSWSGLSLATADLGITLLPYLSLIVPFGMIASVGAILLMSERRHANSLFEGAQALVLAIALLTFWTSDIGPLILGTLGGAALYVALIWWSVGHLGRMPVPLFTHQSPAWRATRASIGVVLLAQVAQSLMAVLDQILIAHVDAGAIAALSYATRLLGLVLALGATAIARAALPIFSDLGAKEPTRFRMMALQWTVLAALAGAVITTLFALLGEPVVALVFERGAFTATDTQRVAWILMLAALQIPFFFGTIVASQGLFSQKRYDRVAIGGSVAFAIKFGAGIPLFMAFGLDGLLVSTGLAYAGMMAMLLRYLTHIVPEMSESC